MNSTSSTSTSANPTPAPIAPSTRSPLEKKLATGTGSFGNQQEFREIVTFVNTALSNFVYQDGSVPARSIHAYAITAQLQQTCPICQELDIRYQKNILFPQHSPYANGEADGIPVIVQIIHIAKAKGLGIEPTESIIMTVSIGLLIHLMGSRSRHPSHLTLNNQVVSAETVAPGSGKRKKTSKTNQASP